MRVLIAGLANYGHIYPLMPVAEACREAGHEVAFALGEELLPLVRSAGFTGHRVGASLEWGWTEATRRHPELSGEPAIAPVASEILADRVVRELLPVLAREKPDLVVHEPYCPGAAIAARLTGVPVVSHVQGRSLPARMHEVLAGFLDRLWREHGGTTPWPAWPEQTFLDFWPPSLQPDPPHVALADRHPVRPVAWSAPADRAPGWVRDDRDRPLVYVVFSTFFGLDDAVLERILHGVAALDADVLAVVGQRRDHTGPLPGNVRVERFVAQAEVLPHADVVVCHGGSGAFLGALAAGLPQLVIPSGADQFANADDLVRVGAGTRLAVGEVTAAAVTEAVTELWRAPAYRRAAGALAEEIAGMPTPADVVPVLSSLTGVVSV